MDENRYYARKIRYLDLWEQGERIGGAGFLKTEAWGRDTSIAVNVKGLHPTDTFDRDVILQTKDREINIGQISLIKGQGQLMYRSDLALSELCGIKIALGGAREIGCQWQDEENSSKGKRFEKKRGQILTSKAYGSAEPEQELMASDRIALDRNVSDTVPFHEEPDIRRLSQETAEDNTPDDIRGSSDLREPPQDKSDISVSGPVCMSSDPDELRETSDISTAAGESRIQDTRRLSQKRLDTGMQAPARSSKSDAVRRRKAVRLMEDKWQQITAIYPHVHPFRDEREYMSISPADFVLLTSSAYRLANNSFLLHGYYNYGHLILARMEQKGEVLYYIGVPGNYYEREKQIAVMFGFESFECGTEPAQAGDFGYYMMRTQL